MFSKYKPTWMVDAIYKITPDQLKKLNIKAVLTDLDNTLIAWNNPDGTAELKEWLHTMKEAGIPVIVVSNNSAERVQRAIEKFELEFVSRAMKPTTKGLKEAQKKLNLPASEIVMVGDQIMTDIKGANTCGMRTILVRPIVNTDSWITKFNRFMERKIMKRLAKKHPEMVWKEGIE